MHQRLIPFMPFMLALATGYECSSMPAEEEVVIQHPAYLVVQLNAEGRPANCWRAHRFADRREYGYVGVSHDDTQIRIAQPFNYIRVQNNDYATAARLLGLDSVDRCIGAPTPPTPHAEPSAPSLHTEPR